MSYILFGDQARDHLLPFTFTRPLADIRMGILTMREKWEKYLGGKTFTLTQDYLAQRFPLVKGADNLLINASIFPNPEIVKKIFALNFDQTLVSGDILIAHRVKESDIEKELTDPGVAESIEPVEYEGEVMKLAHLWDMLRFLTVAIEQDYSLLTQGRKGLPIPSHVKAIAPDKIFIEEGAKIEMAILNASEGPIYIGKNAHIMDGAILRGPVSIGNHSTIKMGAKIYGSTAIGPNCKVGGEVTNSLIFGYSNKAHDGFMGHSVIGEWCNIGADTNTSNLKNNYSEIRLWSFVDQAFVNTRQSFCGTFMGDYAKCGINTMFNSGTVVGVAAQIFGAGYMRNFVPSFAFGGPSGFTRVEIEKVIATEKLTHARRGMPLSAEEEDVLRFLFETHTHH